MGQIKEKFIKKKAQRDLKIEVQEIQANIMLIEDILTKEVTDMEKELEDLKNKIPHKLRAYIASVVSNFTIQNLDFPQIFKASTV